jgi:hypothetical protein
MTAPLTRKLDFAKRSLLVACRFTKNVLDRSPGNRVGAAGRSIHILRSAA